MQLPDPAQPGAVHAIPDVDGLLIRSDIQPGNHLAQGFVGF
jgi:hypothetical protein